MCEYIAFVALVGIMFVAHQIATGQDALHAILVALLMSIIFVIAGVFWYLAGP